MTREKSVNFLSFVCQAFSNPEVLMREIQSSVYLWSSQNMMYRLLIPSDEEIRIRLL